MADCSGLPGFSPVPISGHSHASASDQFSALYQEPEYTGAAGVLIKHYSKVFRTGNRNAASHLWSSFLFNQSVSKSAAEFEDLFTGFCGISGSVVLPISAESRWRLTLQDVSGGQHTGIMYYCTGCYGWPCLCDARENMKIDTKTVVMKDGSTKQYKVAVVGNPCKTQAMSTKLYAEITDPMYQGKHVTLQMAAPELFCAGSVLQGATLSDHGHIIEAMFFDDNKDVQAHNEGEFTEMCASRGNAGMGPIFRTLASVNPL